MKNLKPLLTTFGVGIAAAYVFALGASKFGPLPGLGVRSPVVK